MIQRIGPCWLALALLLWCVLCPFGAPFVTAPVHRLKDAHCILVLGPGGLVRRFCRRDGSPLKSRALPVIATLSEWQPPAGTVTSAAPVASVAPVTNEAMSAALSVSPSNTQRLVATLIEYQAPAVSKEASSILAGGASSEDTSWIGWLAVPVIVAAFVYYVFNNQPSSKDGNSKPTTSVSPAVATAGAAPAPSTEAAPAPTTAASPASGFAQVFTPGQRVRLLYPPKLAGKEGSIVGPAGPASWAESDCFAVQLASGSIFYFASKSLESAVPARA